MTETINNRTCVIEMTPPSRSAKELETKLQTYGERFQRIMESGFMTAISDNVMGIPHPQPCELIRDLNLQPRPNQVIVHVNTFHTKEEVDATLRFCEEKGITHFLCLTGDGSEDLPKLQAEEIGADPGTVVTSVELIRYMKQQYPAGIWGVAFNPYESEKEEIAKMHRKVEAGADFVITQPVLGDHPAMRRLLQEFPDLPVIVECWFSKRLDLLANLIGDQVPEGPYNGFEKLLELRRLYPTAGNCMSMIGFKENYTKVEELWADLEK